MKVDLYRVPIDRTRPGDLVETFDLGPLRAMVDFRCPAWLAKLLIYFSERRYIRA
jgi:hypothetical protein